MTAPSKATVDLVGTRDQWRCARCGDRVRGERGHDWSVHHRTPRQMGGSKAAWLNGPGNLLLLCGSGTTGCHGLLESFRIEAQEAGFIVRRGITRPANVPVQHAVHGLVLLDDEGGWTPAETREEATTWV